MKSNLTKVKVYPKDLKAIPDILPFNKLICGDPVEMELDKKEIQRCMNFGDVFDITSREEVLIDELSYKEIVEFVEEDSTEEETPNDAEEQVAEETPTEPNTTENDEVDPEI